MSPGDLVHGDRHGVQTIPLEIADRVPAAAHEILQQRQRLIGLSRAPNFKLDEFRKAVMEVDSYFKDSSRGKKD